MRDSALRQIEPGLPAPPPGVLSCDGDAIRAMAAEAGTLAVQIADALGHADAIAGEMARQAQTYRTCAARRRTLPTAARGLRGRPSPPPPPPAPPAAGPRRCAADSTG